MIFAWTTALLATNYAFVHNRKNPATDPVTKSEFGAVAYHALPIAIDIGLAIGVLILFWDFFSG